MKVKDLIKELQRVENQDHFIHLLGNHTNGEDEDFDIFFNNIEVWDDGDESITLFMSNITELDEYGEPIEQTPKKNNMTIEDLLNNPLVFVYSESDDEFATYTYNFNEIKQVIEAHNEDFETDYKTINEFNDGEEYRTIKTI